VDSEGRFLFVNETWRETLGYSTNELELLKLWDILAEECIATCSEHFKQVMQGTSFDDLDVIFKAKDGRRVYLNGHASCVFEGDKPLYTRTLLRDVTEERSIRSTLHSQQERYRAILNNAATGIAVVSVPALKFVEANPAWLNMVGYTQPELLQYSPTELVHPDDRLSLVNGITKLTSGRSSGYHSIKRFLHKEGSEFWGDISLSPLRNEDEEISGLIAICTDITERKLIEEKARSEYAKLKTMISGMEEGILFTDSGSIVIEINDYFHDQLNVDRNHALGFHLRDVIARIDEHLAEEIMQAIDGFRKSGHGIGVVFQERIAGIETYLRLQPVYRDGQFDGSLVNVIDVTELVEARRVAEESAEQVKQFADELEAKNRELEAATKAKSDFLATMSHEIRTPMNGVIGMAELIMKTELNAEQQVFASTIYDSATSLLSIINDILDFSKAEAGKMELENIDFDLRNTVDGTIDLMTPKAEEKNLAFGAIIEIDVPIMLKGDPGRLRQVLNNLLGNAIKFTEEGEVTLHVSVIRETETDVKLMFEVVDTGCGIPENKRHRLFQSFSQVDSSTTRTHGGTGLGLAISKQLVELMDGEVGVDSVEAEGSIFWFSAKFDKQLEMTEIDPVTLDDLRGLRILVVDSSATNCRIIGHTLSQWGCEVEPAYTAVQALEMLATGLAEGDPFNLALIDYRLSAVSGEELARKIRSRPEHAHMPLVMLTSSGKRGDAARMQRAGFNSYLVKPVKQSLLLESLKTVLGLSISGDTTPQPSKVLITQHSLRDMSTPRLKILVAEDNKTNRMLTQNQLTKAGHKVVFAETGVEAVQLMLSESFDAILMDCQMPEMDGYEATRAIRELDGAAGRIPIIACTANAMPGDREKCLECGMDEFITKPVKSEILFKTLNQLTAGRQRILEDEAGYPNAPAIPEEQLPAIIPDTEAAAIGGAQARSPQAGLPIDIERSIERAGDREFWEELITTYVEETTRLIYEMEESLGKNDIPLFQRQAHTIKGSSAEMAIEPMRATSEILDRMGKDRDLSGAGPVYDSLKSEYKRLLDYLREQQIPF
jgi:PAS domain S-box-containing protein